MAPGRTSSNSESSPIDDRKEREQLIKTFVIYGGLTLICLVLVSLRWVTTCSPALYLAALGGAGLVYLAASLGGSFLGFLFGIPRASPDRKGAGDTDNGTDNFLGVNTNLEQISDWLTKILVGVGLTQLPDIGTNIMKVATVLAPALSIGRNDTEPVALTAAILVAGTVTGFLFAYIYTRTFVALFFRRSAHRELGLLKTMNALLDELLPESPKQESSAAVSEKVEKLALVDTSQLTTATGVRAVGKARFWKSDMSGAAEAFKRALELEPDDIKARRDYGRSQVLLGLVKEGLKELELARKAAEKENPALAQEIELYQVWGYLYLHQEDGYKEAIERGEALLAKEPHLRRNAQLNTYLACAYGQAHSSAQRRQQPDEAAMWRDKAVAAVRAVRNAPDSEKWVLLLKRLLRPNSNSYDRDLESLQGDDEIEQLLPPSH